MPFYVWQLKILAPLVSFCNLNIFSVPSFLLWQAVSFVIVQNFLNCWMLISTSQLREIVVLLTVLFCNTIEVYQLSVQTVLKILFIICAGSWCLNAACFHKRSCFQDISAFFITSSLICKQLLCYVHIYFDWYVVTFSWIWTCIILWCFMVVYCRMNCNEPSNRHMIVSYKR
jgi:uncharacterized membrane protein